MRALLPLTNDFFKTLPLAWVEHLQKLFFGPLELCVEFWCYRFHQLVRSFLALLDDLIDVLALVGA